MKLVIPKSTIDFFRVKALNSVVEECGLLVGRIKDDKYYVKALFIAKNLDNSPISFKMDPYTILSAYSYADKYGLDVIGTIHSHPASPRPSPIDLRNMAIWNIPWVIMDSRSGEYRVWIYRDKVIEVEYIILE